MEYMKRAQVISHGIITKYANHAALVNGTMG
jgi:hypothetical protein